MLHRSRVFGKDLDIELNSTPASSFWNVTTKLSLIELIAWGSLYYLFAGVLPILHAETGWAHVWLGLGVSIALFIAGFLAPIVGRRIDNRGPREVMITSVVTSCVGLLIWSLSSSVVAYLFAWILIGAGMAGILYPAAFAAIVRLHPQRSRQGILAITLIAALASTIFVPTSNLLAHAIGWRETVRVFAVLLVCVLLPLTITLPKVPRNARIESSIVPPKNSADRVRSGNTTAFVALAVALMLADAVSISFNVYLIGMLIELGQSEVGAAAIASLAGVSKIGGRLLISVCSRFSPLVLLQISLVTKAIALGLPLFLPGGWCLSLMVVLFGVTDGARTLLRPAMVLALFDPHSFGVTNGKLQMFVSFSESVAPFLFGALIVTFGWNWSWGTLVIFLAGAFFVLLLVTAESSETDRPA